MPVAVRLTELERQIVEVVSNAGTPLAPAEIGVKLAALQVVPSQTALRDAIWSLIHAGQLTLLPDRRVVSHH